MVRRGRHDEDDADEITVGVEVAWETALEEWRAGRPQPLAKLLRGARGAIPTSARLFLADLLEGRVARPRGRPKGGRLSPEMLRAAVRLEMAGIGYLASEKDLLVVFGEALAEGQPVKITKATAMKRVAERFEASLPTVAAALYKKS